LRRPLNADAAAQIALLNNRHLQARLQEIGISQADYLEASLPSNPSFSASFRFPDRPPSATNIEYSVAQDVLSLFLIPLKKAVAKREMEITRLRVAGDVLGLVDETKSAFYRLQAQRQLSSRLDLIVKSNEAAADLAKRLHDAGNINDLALANQQAMFSQSRVDAGKIVAEMRMSREELNRLMGLWGAQTNWKIGDELPAIPGREMSFANLESKGIAKRVDVAAARERVNRIGYSLALKQRTRFTPIGIDLGVSTEKETDGSRVTGPTVDIQLPIFNFGQGSIGRLKAQYTQAQRDLEAIAIDARSEVRQARDLVIANRDLAEYYRTVLLPQRLLILNQTQLQYNAMQIGPLELLSAKERELEAERAYIGAWRDYWIARSTLERALHGTSGDMSAVSPNESPWSPMMENQSTAGH
jgi:cobalt-zinc-cadmium efflux system outer membrane protein